MLKASAGTDATASAAVTKLETKVTAIKNWPPDKETGKALKTLYEAAEAAVKKIGDAPVIKVTLTKFTTPKFMHSAQKAGKLPVWTFGFKDTTGKKAGASYPSYPMTTAMTKDEPTAKKMMLDAAIKKVKEEYPKATVTVSGVD